MLRGYILFAMLMVVLKAMAADDATSGLWRGFDTPQDTARTKVWWFHGQTETTREGITADLEAFKRQGVGGVVFYNQVHGKQASVALKVFSPEWWQMFVFAAKESKRLGLTFETHVSDGYVAGGPWITPDLGMQMLVAGDTVVEGGRVFDGAINLPENKFKYHSDVALLAFPLRDNNWQRSKVISKDRLLTISADTGACLLLINPLLLDV